MMSFGVGLLNSKLFKCIKSHVHFETTVETQRHKIRSGTQKQRLLYSGDIVDI